MNRRFLHPVLSTSRGQRVARLVVLMALVLGCAGAADAQQRPAKGVPTAPEHRQNRDRGRAYPGADRAPGVEVYIAPETEHAPSNYVPDNYRLQDYDGRPDQPTFCSGESGSTISTRQTPCPPGQSPSTGGRTISTSPR